MPLNSYETLRHSGLRVSPFCLDASASQRLRLYHRYLGAITGPRAVRRRAHRFRRQWQ
jgi:hypothetical protein